MRVDVYGRYQLEIAREGGRWVAHRLAPGKRMRIPELAIPAHLSEGEIPEFLDDLYHEMSKPGQSIRIVPEAR
jgi:hypothetical protein